MKKKVYLATDHGGFELKEELKVNLKDKGYEVVDVGNKVKDPKDDYPDFVLPLAKQVAQEGSSFGIVMGRSGNGEQIAANKVKGIRAALCMNAKMAEMARKDNNANILTLGADYIDVETAERVVDAFLSTDFSEEERHKRRLKKIKNHESSNN